MVEDVGSGATIAMQTGADSTAPVPANDAMEVDSSEDAPIGSVFTYVCTYERAD